MNVDTPEFKKFEDYFLTLIELLEGRKSNSEAKEILEDYLNRNRDFLSPELEHLLSSLLKARASRGQS